MKNHLYIINVNILDSEELFRSSYEKMSEHRRKKIDAFRFMKDKKLSLGAGMLLREALIREGVSGGDFEYNKNEKPFLTGRDDLYFNLSHSGTMAVCAVSDRPVGVDIEKRQHFEESFIRHVYLPEEADYITSNFNDPDKVFSELWTIKESIMKFFGTGLSLEPDKITVDLTRPISAVCQGFDASELKFTQYPAEGYALTVCSEYENFTEAPEWLFSEKNDFSCADVPSPARSRQD